jgi:hypothetical protein
MLRTRMESRLQRRESVILEHVEERLFAKAQQGREATRMQQEVSNNTSDGKVQDKS